MVTVEATQHVTVTATSFEFARAGGEPGMITVPGGLALRWTSGNTDTATVSPLTGTSTSITGQAPGNTQVYLDVTNPATLPAGVILSAGFEQDGDAVPVTVTPTTYRITDITGPANPIKTVGWKSFQVTTVGAPAGVDSVHWVVDLNAWNDGDTLKTYDKPQSVPLSVYIRLGTYPIRINARAYVGGQETAIRYESWNVCNEGPQLAGKSDAPDGEVGINTFPGCDGPAIMAR